MTTIMEQQERIRLLLSMQEHPERYTDEQVTQMLADDPQLAALMEQLALTKRAFVKQEADEEALPMDDLWEQFASEHEEALAALESRQEQAHPGHPLVGSPQAKILGMAKWQRRVAAVFFGVMLTAGLAFAAIHIVRHFAESKSVSSGSGIENPLHPQQLVPSADAPADTSKTDTATLAAPSVSLEPIIFDNKQLGEMLPQIAAFYHAEVSFQNEDARQLRFHFVWKREDGLVHAIEKLNRFESLSVRLDGNTVIVE